MISQSPTLACSFFGTGLTKTKLIQAPIFPIPPSEGLQTETTLQVILVLAIFFFIKLIAALIFGSIPVVNRAVKRPRSSLHCVCFGPSFL